MGYITVSFLLHSSELNKPDTIKAKHIMQQHQMKVINQDPDEFQRINVRRSKLFADAFRAFARHTFDVSKMLRVVFIAEPPVDDGGPQREFYQLVIKAVFTSGLFSGWPHNVVPLHNVEAVTSNTYFIIGKMIATSLVQGEPPPLCFAAAIADYLIYDEIKSGPCIDDIPNHTIRQKVQQVLSVCN